jgi:hypothetical protein
VGAASCPDQVRLANGTMFTCTVKIEGVTAPYSVTLGDVVQKVTAVVKDLKGTVVVRS